LFSPEIARRKGAALSYRGEVACCRDSWPAHPVSERGGVFVRPPADEKVPPEVYHYLLPHERRVITVRRHPVVLAGPLGLLTARRKDVTALRGAWGASGVGLFVSAIRLYAWLSSYVVVTNFRLLRVKNLASTKVNTIQLREIRGIDMHRSVLGRLFGYGTFIIRSADRDEKIRYLPYPEQLYLELTGILNPDPHEDDD
jgi:hypothetical protein